MGNKLAAQGMTTQTPPMYPNYFSICWEIGFPANSGYLTNTSFSGGRLEYRRFINKSFSVGMSMSWNSFDQHFGSKTYQSPSGNEAVTTDMVRQVYTLPLMATAHYYFGSTDLLKPYVGIGIGATYSEQNAYFNVYQLTADNWGFAVRPEAGLLIHLGPEVFAQLGAGYTVSTNHNSDFKINSLKQWGIDIGIGFAY